MAISLGVGPTDARNTSTGNTIAVTLTGTTAGRTLVIGVRWRGNAVTLSSITITSESNATIIGSAAYDAGPDTSLQMAYLTNTTTTGDKTITATLSGNSAQRGIFAMELFGSEIVDYDNAEASANGTSTRSTTLTTNTANAAIVAQISTNGTAPSAGTGYTQIVLNNIFWLDEGEYNLDAGVAGSKTVDFTGTNNSWVIKGAAFKENAPAGGQPYVKRTGGVPGLSINRGIW